VTPTAATSTAALVAGNRALVPGTQQPVQPIFNYVGELPELNPGSSQALLNGVSVPVVIEAIAYGWQMVGGDFTFELEIPKANGESGSTEGVVTLTRSREVEVSGQGFAPGTLVDVWLFSSPTFLGTVLVDADGTFKASLEVSSGIAIGEHTLQANGISSDGATRSLNLGVRVVDAAIELPATGATWTLRFVSLWVFMTGVIAVSIRRRLIYR
jgi:hypothetical protein